MKIFSATIALSSIVFLSLLGGNKPDSKPTIVSTNAIEINQSDYPALENKKEYESYPEEIKEIDSLLAAYQPKAARTALTELMQKAIKEKSEPTIIECAYRLRQTLYNLETDDQVNVLFNLDTTVQQLDGIAKPILQVYLAEYYINFYGFNFFNSETKSYIKGDKKLSDWTRRDYAERALFLVEDALKYEKEMMATPSDGFYIQTKDVAAFSPTVYDFIAPKIIGILNNYNLSVNGILSSINLGDSIYCKNSLELAKHPFNDSVIQERTMEIYSSLELLHKFNERPYPYVKNVGARMQYYYNNNTQYYMAQKERTYAEIAKELEDHPAHLFFDIYNSVADYNLGKTYHFKNYPQTENNIKIAHDNLTKAINKYPKSLFREEADQLIKTIESEEFSVSGLNKIGTEDQQYYSFTYRNIDTVKTYLYFKSFDEKSDRGIDRESLEKGKYTLVKQENIALPNKGIYQKRSLEFANDNANKLGEYHLITVSKDINLADHIKNDEDWRELNKSVLSFHVSDIVVATRTNDAKLAVIVTDTKKNKPISKATVRIYKNEWRSDKYSYNQIGKETTNENGVCEVAGEYARKWNVETEDGWAYGSMYTYRDYPDYENTNSVKILLDRKIYRPNQTVFFKAIAFSGKKNDYQVDANRKLTVEVRDPNSQIIFTKELITNEFGSINGDVKIPADLSLGNYYIYVRGKNINAYENFSVEEYKRPTFEAALELPEGESKLNDSVYLKGNAMAFAGYGIAGATVKLKVQRTLNIPYWRYYYGGYYNSNSTLIAEIEETTDDEGKFDISFFSETPPDADESDSYTYSISGTVTDITGETHEVSQSLTLSNNPYKIKSNLPSEIEKSDLEKVQLEVTNLYDVFQKDIKGSFIVYHEEPQGKLESRIWSEAEHSNLDKNDYEKQFPHKEFEDIGVQEPLRKKIGEASFVSGDSLDLKQFIGDLEGIFHIDFKATSPEGKEIIAKNQIEIIDSKSTKMPFKNAFMDFSSNGSTKVGETATWVLGTSLGKSKVFYEVRRGDEKVCSKWISIEGKQMFEYEVQPEDRGGISIIATLFHQNRAYSNSTFITVPHDDKKLKIKTETFRDKLLPGQDETWKFTITGPESEKVSAEILAGMYDASLDQFRSNSWYLNPYYNNSSVGNFNTYNAYPITASGKDWSGRYYYNSLESDLRSRGSRVGNTLTGNFAGAGSGNGVMYDMDESSLDYAVEEVSVAAETKEAAPPAPSITLDKKELNNAPKVDADQIDDVTGGVTTQAEAQVIPRTNFNETAFFYPNLKTNESGEVVIEFTVPESLTKWKMMMLAHTKDVKIQQLTKEVITQKELMVTTNAPRFFRENDSFNFTGKVINLSEKQQDVEVSLEFFDPITNEPLNLIFGRQPISKNILLEAGKTEKVAWDLKIPASPNLVAYRLIAKGTDFSDGEEKPIPLLPNKMMVTESMPFLLTKSGTYNYTFDKLKNNNSTTLENHSYTIEYTTNPVWNGVLALPYMMEYPYECAEQTFSRFYANALATKIANSNPKIKSVFEAWSRKGKEAFTSKLNQNEELKSALLQEAPWVLDANSEEEQMANLGNLFDLNKMASEGDGALRKLKAKQNSDGGWGWFGGKRSNAYITQHILVGFAQLSELGVDYDDKGMTRPALAYLNKVRIEEFDKYSKDQLKNGVLSENHIQWMYLQSFEENKSDKVTKMIAFYEKKLNKDWGKYSLQIQALAGIYYVNSNNEKMKNVVLASFRDRALEKKDTGMYFAQNNGGYYWYNNKIESHAAITEFFVRAGGTTEEINKLRLYLILNKQTNGWESTKATANACYALLLNGTDFLSNNNLPLVKVGSRTIVYNTSEITDNSIYVKPQPGTGYFKKKWTGNEVKKEMADVSITKTNEEPSYGAAYWQYFEQMDKVTASNGPMKISKKYYSIENGKKGDELVSKQKLQVGDKIRVRIDVTSDKDMEFIHLKDLRGSGFEPVQTLSSHQYIDGLWCYSSVKDVSMNYFIDYMPKGKYTFEYDIYVTNTGDFSVGNATVQSMYAPEFSANTGGIRLIVE